MIKSYLTHWFKRALRDKWRNSCMKTQMRWKDLNLIKTQTDHHSLRLSRFPISHKYFSLLLISTTEVHSLWDTSSTSWKLFSNQKTQRNTFLAHFSVVFCGLFAFYATTKRSNNFCPSCRISSKKRNKLSHTKLQAFTTVTYWWSANISFPKSGSRTIRYNNTYQVQSMRSRSHKPRNKFTRNC